MCRRAISNVIPLTSNTIVFAHMMDGNTRCPHSPDPWRTYNALVNAAKDIVMAKIATQMPVLEVPAGLEGADSTSLALCSGGGGSLTIGG
jgi:hypothetical protein